MTSTSIEDDEPLALSSSTLSALQEFYADRDARQKAFEDLKFGAENEAEGRNNGTKLSMDMFQEDWNESQFWYSQETATALANQLLEGATKDTRIAVVSAPSVFVQLKNILGEQGKPVEEQPQIFLLEFDERFGLIPDGFVFYDFHKPLKLPPALKGSIDRIICDPPFLSEDCQTKAALTVRWLSKSWGKPPAPQTTASPDSPRLIVCTGERMETLVNKLYGPQGIKTTTFEPAHANALSNEFYCFANFECNEWTWKAT